MKKSIFKKTLATMLALMMVLGTLAALPLSIGAETQATAWDGSTTTQPTGNGTQANPYQIADGANLAWLSANAYTLTADVTYLTFTADIDMGNKDFTPIDMTKAVVVAGNGKTISNLSITSMSDAGLFVQLYSNSAVTDLHFAKCSVAAATGTEEVAGGKAGMIAAYVQGPVTITSCSTDAASTLTGQFVGGLCGTTVVGTGAVTFDKCLNRASITVTSIGKDIAFAAGMLAMQVNGTSATFTYCINEGTLTGLAASRYAYMGGILGKAEYKGGNAGMVSILENCYNVGKMTTTMNADNVKNPAQMIGGMIAHMQAELCKIINCYDYSERDIATNAPGAKVYHFAMIGDGAGTETQKVVTDAYAVNHPDSKSFYTAIVRPAFIDAGNKTLTNFDNAANIKPSLVAKIAVSNGQNSTVLAEMTKIAAQVAGATVPQLPAGATDSLSRDYAWYTADGGTEANPYLIGTPAAWAGFTAMANGTYDKDVTSFDGKYVKLTADIDMTGYVCAPINQDGNKLTIHVDGAGHTISNLTQANNKFGGLFGIVSAGSTFANLTIKDINTSSQTKSAAFVAECNGSISFTNCRTEGGAVVGKTYVAGFLAHNTFTADEEKHNVIFDACINEADILVDSTSNGFAAGFLAHGDGKSGIVVSMRYCVNKGDVTIKAITGDNAIGGFIGAIRYDSMHTTIVEACHCYNIGKLTLDAGEARAYMGGFIGWGNMGGELFIESVYDYSARSGMNKNTNTKAPNRHGGLVGECADSECIKILNYCYALNADDSVELYSTLYAAVKNAASMSDITSKLLVTADDTITFRDTETTLAAELARIDELLASVDPATGAYTDPNPGFYEGPDMSYDPEEDDENEDDTTDATDDDTKPEDTNDGAADSNTDNTDATVEEGCGSSVSATFAVLALTAACGMAIVGKKKED